MTVDTTTTSTAPSRKLTLDDISDVRAYERERSDVRARVMDLKRRRRIAVGTMVTITFESRETMRYQIQEMARVEKLISDEDIQVELDTYNPMVPEPGQLCATLFLELTSDEQVREWLPKLVGIERSVVLRLADGDTVRALTDESHAAQLTRETVTAAVHYVRFEFTPAQVEAFASGPVHLGIDHPAYDEDVELAPSSVAELLADLRP